MTASPRKAARAAGIKLIRRLLRWQDEVFYFSNVVAEAALATIAIALHGRNIANEPKRGLHIHSFGADATNRARTSFLTGGVANGGVLITYRGIATQCPTRWAVLAPM